jgi:hypothetical protein
VEVISHTVNQHQIAEVLAEEVFIKDSGDGLDLLGNLYYQGFDKIIIYEKDLTEAFFDLQNGMAGEILQKFSNYRVRLVIVGDFSKYTRKSITDFIYESNQGRQVNFLPSLDLALKSLAS